MTVEARIRALFSRPHRRETTSSVSYTHLVNYATANGTATAGSDYTATSGTLTFAAGETTKTVSVPVLGDTSVESDETFTLTLSNPAGATLGAAASATATIVNDDGGANLGNNIIRISTSASGAESNMSNHYPGVSADGHYVAFVSSSSNLVPNDTNGFSDVFVKDTQTCLLYTSRCV